MYQKLILKNNTRVIFVPYAASKAITVLALFPAGSRYEPGRINGVSHFIEHMFFKGTLRRPNTLAISRELDSVGAEYNAFTAKDHTGYYIKSDARHIELSLDILSDMLYNSKLEEKELNRECNVILEEIHMYKDNPMMHIEDMIEELVFVGSSLGWPIGGNKESMQRTKREDVLSYKDRFYSSPQMVLCLAGAIDEQTKKLVSKYFGSKGFKPYASRGARAGRRTKFRRFESEQRKPQIKIEYKETDQVQLALGFPSFPYLDKRLPAQTLLSVILGGTMSSRLFIEVREKRGLAYFVRSETEPYQDTGAFLIRAGLNKEKLDLAIATILKEIKHVCEKGVTTKELQIAKENIRGHLTLNLEDSSALAGWFGKQEILTNKIKTPEQKFKELERVTKEKVHQVARKILKRNKLNLALIGPTKDESRIAKLLRSSK